MLSRKIQCNQMHAAYSSFKTLIDTIFDDLSDQEVEKLPDNNEACLNMFVNRSLSNTGKYGEALAEAIHNQYDNANTLDSFKITYTEECCFLTMKVILSP
jgi:hypothetical protein